MTLFQYSKKVNVKEVETEVLFFLMHIINSVFKKKTPDIDLHLKKNVGPKYGKIPFCQFCSMDMVQI